MVSEKSNYIKTIQYYVSILKSENVVVPNSWFYNKIIAALKICFTLLYII